MIGPLGTGAIIGDQSVMPGWSISRELHRNWRRLRLRVPLLPGELRDFDPIGQRKPQSHWRDAVTGRSPVELMVERPTPAGTEQVAL